MNTPKNIIPPAQLGIAAATLYAAPAQTTTVIKKLTFTNTTTATASLVTVYLIPSGGTAGDATTLRKTRSVAAGDVYECVEAANHVLGPGGAIQAFASVASSITVIGSGLEIG